ncbi:hypothetical protein ACIRRA_38455 [Nocardia sp. NPDC101769]|uniref:hypothetical protein n=1 Tax=Nocardia sp. NPDC101769 TaxID=3364333 RepID=UPI00381F9F42
MVRGADDGRELYWNTFVGTKWTSFTKFRSGTTSKAPALAVFDGKLYCAIRGSGNEDLPGVSSGYG